jgi:hypothetical protein
LKKLIGLDRYLIIDCEETFSVLHKGVAVPFNPGRYLIDTNEYPSDLDLYIDEKVMMYSVPFFPSPIRVYDVMSVSDVNSATLINAPMAQQELKLSNVVNQIAEIPLVTEYDYLNIVQGVTTANQVIEFVGGKDVFNPALPVELGVNDLTAEGSIRMDYLIDGNFYLIKNGNYVRINDGVNPPGSRVYYEFQRGKTGSIATFLRFLFYYYDGETSEMYFNFGGSGVDKVEYSDANYYLHLKNVDTATIYKVKV